MWATDTHCSNNINVGVNRGGLRDRRDHKLYDGVFMGSRLPFRWRWARASGVFNLKAGDNYVHVFPHETGEYLLKVQSDDQMLLWIDGERVYRADTMRSVIRNSAQIGLRLEKGRRRIRMRVNQGQDVPKLQGSFWKASLRFRTKDDTLTHVTGADPVRPGK